MRKILMGALVAALVCLFISGCGGSGSDDSNGSSNSIIGLWKLTRLTRIYTVEPTDKNATTLTGTCPGDIDLGDYTTFHSTGNETLTIKSDGNLLISDISFSQNSSGTVLSNAPTVPLTTVAYTYDARSHQLIYRKAMAVEEHNRFLPLSQETRLR